MGPLSAGPWNETVKRIETPSTANVTISSALVAMWRSMPRQARVSDSEKRAPCHLRCGGGFTAEKAGPARRARQVISTARTRAGQGIIGIQSAMSRPHIHIPALLLLALVLPASIPTVRAQTGEPAPPGRTPGSRLVSGAVAVADAPTIDGALDERMWQDAVPLTGFIQSEPFEGAPASESTEVRILYDDQAIYVGVICYDRDPSVMATTDTRRDAGLGEMDSFQMIFDTFHDQQNGFVFGTNAAGVQYDAQVRDQGDQEESWDGSWEVRTKTTPASWIAEFRIPLRTLRYGPAPQTWGVNFFRNIQRTRERTYWAPLPRIYSLERLSSAGELRGLDLESPRNFKLLPYVVGSANRTFSPGADTDLHREIGVDAKFGLTPSMTLDVTVNTDFAQVEVDTQQINLTRF